MSIDYAHQAAAGQITPEVAAWITEAMRRHLAGDDLEHALALDRASRLREQAAGRAAAGDHDLAIERARLAHHNANIAAMEERRRAGELCDTAGVVLVMARIGSNFRTALERVADKLADRLAAEADPHACHQVINAELQQTLDQLAKDCEAAALDIKGERHEAA